MDNNMAIYQSEEIQEFLNDFERNLEISFDIEESKKKELVEVAKNKGILVEGSRDLAIFSGVYEILDQANGNRKIVPLDKDVLRKLPQLIGKPINIKHIRRYVVGFICDFKYIEKGRKIIIYGIFFKSCFDNEWDELVKAFNDKKIGLSSEIWSPKSKRVYKDNGNYELKDIEFAGVAIIYMDDKTKPAEKECLVLEISQKKYDSVQELVFSSLNTDNLKIYSCEECSSGGNCGVNCENLICSSQEISVPSQSQPNKIKIICSGCSHNFEYLFIPNQTSSIKCPNCLAILDQTGKILYPPQIQNFDLSCPNCSARNWLILDSKDNGDKIKCQSCAKEYDLTFKEISTDLKMMLSKIQFLHTGQKTCWQCGTYNNFIVPSNQEKINLTCKKCGLPYFFNVSHQIKKDIKSIEESGIKKDENKIKEEQEMVELEKAKLEIEGLNKSLKDKDLENSALKEGITKSKLVTKKLLRKAVGKIRDAKKKQEETKRLGVPRTDEERAQNHFKISAEDWGKLSKEKKQEYIDKLPKRGFGLSKSILRKAVKKIRDNKKALIEKDLEISSLKNQLEEVKKIKEEKPVTSAQLPEVPTLETASLRIGDEIVADLDGRNKRIEKIRAQQQAYLNPTV